MKGAKSSKSLSRLNKPGKLNELDKVSKVALNVRYLEGIRLPWCKEVGKVFKKGSSTQAGDVLRDKDH